MNNENYLFGNICGDSDLIVDQLIENGQKFDLILTDPPYNINKDFGNNSDCLPLDDFINVTNERIKKLKQVLTPTGSIIWFSYTINIQHLLSLVKLLNPRRIHRNVRL